MAPILRRSFALLASAVASGCGWLPPDSPATAPAPSDPDAPALHAWKVTGHVLGARALVSDLDAAGFHGRGVTLGPAAYSSPWSGSCDQANRQRATRRAAELATELELPPGSLGLADPVTEYRLSCATGSAPGLQLYVSGDRAATCFAGVCYLLAHDTRGGT